MKNFIDFHPPFDLSHRDKTNPSYSNWGLSFRADQIIKCPDFFEYFPDAVHKKIALQFLPA